MLPICKIISPANNASFCRGDTVVITISAVDPDGTISEVQLHINNVGITSLQTFPYNYEWNTEGETEGTHEIKAIAIDKQGARSNSIISITIESSFPIVTTLNITEITYQSALSGGSVINNGVYPITSRGIVWDTLQNPSVNSNSGFALSGTGSGDYVCSLTDLQGNKTYYVRAFATNNNGTAYGEEHVFTTLPQFGTFTDSRDNTTYKWVAIGNQTWMAENLKATKFNDGTSIHLVTDNSVWANLNNPGFCWYDTTGYGITYYDRDTFGALYNWYTVNTGKLCPTGWHLPSDTEWIELIGFLGGSQVAGGKMKEAGTTYWKSPNIGATNESGFTAIPGGGRYFNGSFFSIGLSGLWWSSTEGGATNAWGHGLDYNNAGFYRNDYDKEYGFSVRCVRDK